MVLRPTMLRSAPSAQQVDMQLFTAPVKVAIEAVHAQSRQTYDPLRMQPELMAQGFPAGRDRIVRLRRELGLRCNQKRKFKATTSRNLRAVRCARKSSPYGWDMVGQCRTGLKVPRVCHHPAL